MTNVNDLNLDVVANNINFATATQRYQIPNAESINFHGRRVIE